MTDSTFDLLARKSADAAVQVANKGLELYLHDQDAFDEMADDCDPANEWIIAIHRYVGACETLAEYKVMREQEQFNEIVGGIDD